MKRTVYVFVDFDGVFNSFRFWKDRKKSEQETEENCMDRHREFDPEAVARFSKVIADARAEGILIGVIVSSSWRYISNVREIMEAVGLPMPIGKTPLTEDAAKIYGEKVTRGNEISLFLHQDYREIDDYVVIDDMDVSHFEAHKDNFLQTRMEVGFRDVHAELLAKRLRGTSSLNQDRCWECGFEADPEKRRNQAGIFDVRGWWKCHCGEING